MDVARAHDALRDATLWDGHSPLRLRRASSDIHSNLTIDVRCDAGRFALRLPRQRSGDFIDRSDERRALNLAWRIGIGAEPIHVDPTTGIVVTRWIEDATPISAQSLVSDALRLERAADMLARLHRSGDRFTQTRDPAAVLAAYRARLADALWDASTEAALQIALLRMQTFATDATASHGDAAPANFLDAPIGCD